MHQSRDRSYRPIRILATILCCRFCPDFCGNANFGPYLRIKTYTYTFSPHNATTMLNYVTAKILEIGDTRHSHCLFQYLLNFVANKSVNLSSYRQVYHNICVHPWQLGYKLDNPGFESGRGKRMLAKGKAFPLQAWTGPWGSRRLRLQNF